MEKTKITILLVEDSPEDVILTQTALKQAHFDADINIRDTVEESLTAFYEAPPDIVLLDLNLPGLNGKHFLREVRKYPQYDYIPIIILTTSNSVKDKEECMKSGADLFIVKTLFVDDFVEDLAQIHRLFKIYKDQFNKKFNVSDKSQ